MNLSGRIVSHQGGRPTEVTILDAIALDRVVRVVYIGGGSLRWADVTYEGWIVDDFTGEPSDKVFRIDR